MRDHREQGPAPPRGPAPDLVLVEPGQALAGLGWEGIARALRKTAAPPDAPDSFECLTSQLGVEMYEWLAQWCRRAEREGTAHKRNS